MTIGQFVKQLHLLGRFRHKSDLIRGLEKDHISTLVTGYWLLVSSVTSAKNKLTMTFGHT